MKHDFVFNVKASDGDGDESTISITVTPAHINGSVIIEGAGGINSVYLPNGYVTSSDGSTTPGLHTPNKETPSVIVNGNILAGDNKPVTDGNDFVATGGDNDHVEGGAGNDTIYLGRGSLNTNDNTPKPDASQFVTISEAELFQGGNESNTLSKFQSPAWADAAHGGDGNDRIFGQEHTDLLSGGMGNDQLFGGSEEDFLRGGSGNDILDGGTENDWLRGEGGNDTLTGGTGKDTYVWGSGDADLDDTWVDTITDFNISEGDTLNLGDLLQADSIVTATDHNGSMVISIDIDGNGDIEQHIVLDGVTVDNGNIVINTSNGDLTITDSDSTVNSTNYTIVMPDDQ
nr:calcium-binding protein [Grimontia sedimenti]